MMVNNNKKCDDNEEGGDWYQILTIIVASLAALTTGIFFAWSSPSIPRIVEDKVNYDITSEQASYFTVLPPVGTICASFIYSALCDVIGRKWTILTIAIPHITTALLTATSNSLYVLYFARFAAGVGDACIFSCIACYVAEIATPKVRGTWGNFMTFCLYFGEWLANVIGSVLSVKSAAWVYLTFPVLFLCFFPFMPETPYYYLMKNRVDDARTSLQRLRRKRNVEAELSQLKADVERQLSETGTWKDLFIIESNRKAIYAGIFLRASQQLGGIGAFTVYTQYIFLKAGGNVSASVSSIILIGLCTILNMCAAFTLDKIGRRRSYFLSSLTCGVILLGEAVYFFLDKLQIDVEFINWFPLFGMILYCIFFSFGLGIVPTLMLGELFSASIKGKGLCILNIVLAALVSSITKLFHVLDTNFGLYSPFLLFSICCLISCVLTFWFVPETQGKTLEQIQQSMKGNDTTQKDNNAVSNS